LGDVNGAGFALDLEGQVVGQVSLTGLAVAARAAAFAAESDQAGGDKRAPGFELFEAGQEMTTDESGMLGYFHGVRECRRDGGIYN